ncbi:MAG: DUF4236 domain-containing protein [Candidatus Kapaibacterium sp.]|jgi:hypothetical protein
MSLSFRRSKKIGPFRITFSKSGISTSFGGKGIRVSKSSRGTYVSAGFAGLRFRQKIDETDATAEDDEPSDTVNQSTPTQSVPTQSVPTQNVPTQSVPAQRIPTQRIPTPSAPAQNTPTVTPKHMFRMATLTFIASLFLAFAISINLPERSGQAFQVLVGIYFVLGLVVLLILFIQSRRSG